MSRFSSPKRRTTVTSSAVPLGDAGPRRSLGTDLPCCEGGSVWPTQHEYWDGAALVVVTTEVATAVRLPPMAEQAGPALSGSAWRGVSRTAAATRDPLWQMAPDAG